ncbi:MAG: ferrous iron transport protein B [Cellulomonas sp. 73-145]|uniref:ferrous iron transport protein B n=1 Tax=Cellulomonas sp. 73-145 TaxID=1895739 RepID=UPI00092B3083|nr:ferrous iron transport protein B [Cellulomonas sp. 73-145]OJV60091.1 MAG: ferrous iron transport protein B [Cellulomonas sp. 73-145]
MSCHESSDVATLAARRGTGDTGPGTRQATVALVGSPNVGKSTLFNAVTGSRQQVVNAPGTTVELATGPWRAAGALLVDLPGAYSLLARTPDEQVTADAVAGTGPLGTLDLVVVLADASALARSLYLVAQVARAGMPVLVGLTMRDVAAARGMDVDPEALATALGVPVVGLDPRTGAGVDVLVGAVRSALDGPPVRLVVRPGASRATGPGATGPDEARALDDLALDDDLDPRLAEAADLFEWVEGVLARLAPSDDSAAAADGARSGAAAGAVRTWSDRVDAWLLRPWVGVPVLLAVMWGLFQLATTAAAPLMDGVNHLVVGWFGGLLRGWLGGAPPWVGGFVVDGLLAGVATVLSFAPLMALMFVAVALLEDSGYLARAAFVADRAMRALGLDGRAVLPLVVGFGCNVAALSATRTLPHARQRLLSGLLIPFTSCTARLTVYLMLAGAFFPGHAGLAVLAMYLLSALLVIGIGLLLRRTAFRDLRREPFVLALPAYQRPRLRAIATSAWVRVRAFVTKAGTIIVITLSAVWVLMAIPATSGYSVAQVPVADSVYGRVAAGIAPVFGPAGFADWHASSALMTGFVAKEVVVGSMAQTYAVQGPTGGAASTTASSGTSSSGASSSGVPSATSGGSLGTQLRATFDRTSGGAPQSAAFAFMVFVLAYTPCLATVAEQRRLFGSRWTAVSVGSSLVIAWLLAVAAFQLGSRLLGA